MEHGTRARSLTLLTHTPGMMLLSAALFEAFNEDLREFFRIAAVGKMDIPIFLDRPIVDDRFPDRDPSSR